jgi:hypothetical protein
MAWAHVPRTWPEIRRRTDPLLIHPSHGLYRVWVFKARRLWYIVCGAAHPRSQLEREVRLADMTATRHDSQPRAAVRT